MSVRSRLEAAARQNEAPEGRSPVRLTNQLVVTAHPSLSQRQKATLAAEANEIEKLPTLPIGQTGRTSCGVGQTNVRDRARIAEFERQEKAVTPTNPIADAYLAEYHRQEAERKQQELDDIKAGRLVIIQEVRGRNL